MVEEVEEGETIIMEEETTIEIMVDRKAEIFQTEEIREEGVVEISAED